MKLTASLEPALAVVNALTDAGWEATMEYPGYVRFPIDSHFSLAIGMHDWDVADVIAESDGDYAGQSLDIGPTETPADVAAALVATRAAWLAARKSDGCASPVVMGQQDEHQDGCTFGDGHNGICTCEKS